MKNYAFNLGKLHVRLPAKILLIMKLVIVMLTTCFLQISAAGFSQKVTIKAKNAPLRQIFNQIRLQSGYNILIDADLLKDAAPVNINIKDVSVEDAVKQVIQNRELSYSIQDRMIILEAKTPSFPARFADTDVRGRVFDEHNVLLPNVTVKIKGSRKSTLTNHKGEFTLLNVGEDAVLVFSYVGYKTIEITSANQPNVRLDVYMIVAAAELEELNVVSTGYQTISKERSAGSFSKPDMAMVYNRSNSMNILQRLDGLVPGLVINNSPNSLNPFQVRGLSTIGVGAGGSYSGTSRNPLYVVDGIPTDNISSVNPQDVADITVLKDATAASIWGARASNGVIVITTKKGTSGNKLKITYDAFVNFQGKPELDYMPALNSRQYIETVTEIFDPVNYPWKSVSGFTTVENKGGVSPHEMILYNRYRGLVSAGQASKSLDSLAAINNVKQIGDLFHHNAMLMNHTVSLSGGGKAYSFYGSLAYTNTQSPQPGDKNNTYKVNLRQDFSLSKNIRFYLITDATNTVEAVKRQFVIDNRFYPYQLFRDENGRNLSTPYMGYLSDSTRVAFQNRSRINLDYVPLDEVNYGYTKSDGLLNRITGGAKIDLFKGLRFEGTYGFIAGTRKITSFDDPKSYQVRTEVVQFTVAPNAAATPVYHLPATGGKYSIENSSQRYWTIRNQLVYDHSWNNDSHQLTLLAGQEANEQLLTGNRSTVRGYDEDLQTFAALNYVTLANPGIVQVVMPRQSGGRSILGNDVFNKNETQIRFTSYYANAAYTYNKKYTINGSWRTDKSNLFGIDKSAQNKPVWSAGVKWMLTEEKFMHSFNWLQRMALRATYGLTGNSPAPGTAASYDVLGGGRAPTLPDGGLLTILSVANRKLVWESTETANLGFDLEVLNRLSLTIDLYNRKTKNLLGQMPVNGFTGYPEIVGNYGNLQNKGLELSVSSLNLRKGDFIWNSMLTLAWNKNTITQLNTPSAITTGDQKVVSSYVTGFPAFAIFAYRFGGLDELGDPMVKLADQSISKEKSAAGLDDIAYMGTFQPVWTGGLSNSFQYKGFVLTTNVSYNLGHVMRRDTGPFYTTFDRMQHYNVMYQGSQGGFTGGQIHPDFLNRWKKPGDEAFTNVPSYISNQSVATARRYYSYYSHGDINVLSASYIKLRDITLAYSLPEQLVRRVHTERITVRAQVSNVMLWKANQYNIDPEFQEPASGRRIPSSPFPNNASLNKQSYRTGQGAITFGISVNF